jgi:multiple sugar transport system substrate-binding protein
MSRKYYILGGILGVLLIIAIILLFTTSGNKANNAKVTLTWWMTFEDSQNVQQLIADYTALHKNVTINFVKKDLTDYESDLVNALAAGNGPDIFTIHNDWLPAYLDKVAPVPDTILNLRTYQDSFADVASSDFVKDGKIYAVPLSTDVLALYYNKDLLGSAGISQPPTTWTELEQDVEKITKISKPGTFQTSGIAMGTSGNVNRAVDILSLLMLQEGTQFYNSDFTSATFDQQQTNSSTPFSPSATALAFYTQFADAGKNSYTWNSQSDQSIDAFTQGKVAMILNYQYLTPIIQSRAPNLNWGVAPIPQISDDVTKVNFANYWGQAVSKSSKNSTAAWNFLNFITQKTELDKYYAQHPLVASRKDILADQHTNPNFGVFADSALTARSVYKKNANLFETVFLQMIDDVTLKNIDPQQAISTAAQQIDLNLRGP